jgi:hypothetical protein
MSVEYRAVSTKALENGARTALHSLMDKEEGKKDDRWSQVSKHHLKFKKVRIHTLS